MSERAYNTKEMGDAGEMLVAGELRLAGNPATVMPKNWPGYDVIAEQKDVVAPQRISVKSRTFVHGSRSFLGYDARSQFDWLAILLLP